VKRVHLIPAAALCLFFTAGCDEAQKKPEPSTTAAPAPAPLSDADLAVPADFEEDAERTITAASYKEELAALDTEINGAQK
jgi:hypothetical protein